MCLECGALVGEEETGPGSELIVEVSTAEEEKSRGAGEMVVISPRPPPSLSLSPTSPVLEAPRQT